MEFKQHCGRYLASFKRSHLVLSFNCHLTALAALLLIPHFQVNKSLSLEYSKHYGTSKPYKQTYAIALFTGFAILLENIFPVF